MSPTRTTGCPGWSQTKRLWPPAGRRTYGERMKKPVVSAFVWCYCGRYAGAMLAHVFGISPVLAPILGATAAFLIAGDPRGVIWPRKPKAPILTVEPTQA